MLRLLVWLILGFLASLFARSFLRSLFGIDGPRPRPAAPGRRGSPPGAVTEQLVRDRVCDTYLPRSRALREVDADGREHFFCSEECRARHHQATA